MRGATAEDVHRQVNRVTPSLIRVEADEVTYNMHILVRFELELALLRDELAAADLPAAWNDAYRRRLGVAPANDGDGVLQDVHWSSGAFGYFPTYTIGNLYSALLWNTIRADIPDIEARIEAGEFAPLLDWLRDRIHRPGYLEEGEDLIRRVTGSRPHARAVHGLPVGQVRRALRREPDRVEAAMAATASPVLDLFRELAAIPSPSGRERPVADRTLDYLRDLGLDPTEDDAGAEIGSDMGNIHVALPPSDGVDGVPIFLNAHLDTVPPTGPIDPEVRNGVVVNRHDTILGADNKAAVVVMLAAVADLVRTGRPHAGVELVLTPMEEVGLKGAKAFDISRLRARVGYCYDHAAPIGNVVLAAPTQRTLRFRFVGRAAHAGIAPRRGEARSSRRPGRSPTCRSGGSTQRRPRTSA